MRAAALARPGHQGGGVPHTRSSSSSSAAGRGRRLLRAARCSPLRALAAPSSRAGCGPTHLAANLGHLAVVQGCPRPKGEPGVALCLGVHRRRRYRVQAAPVRVADPRERHSVAGAGARAAVVGGRRQRDDDQGARVGHPNGDGGWAGGVGGRLGADGGGARRVAGGHAARVACLARGRARGQGATLAGRNGSGDAPGAHAGLASAAGQGAAAALRCRAGRGER